MDKDRIKGSFEQAKGAVKEGIGKATGDEKLLKGGAFNSANYDRTLLPDVQVSNCGFRCVLAAQ